MLKTFKEVFIILVISVIAGFTANALSPNGVPIIGEYSDRLAVDSTSKSSGVKQEKQRTK